jgi:hypothetical protein
MSQQSSRKLPTCVILPEYTGGYHLEAQSVQDKFSNPSAKIGEQNVDYVAKIYMDERATLYWLPRFFEYLKEAAPRDSYHFDVMLFELSDATFVARLRAIATPEECAEVRAYLDWVRSETGLIDIECRRVQLEKAVFLWS